MRNNSKYLSVLVTVFLLLSLGCSRDPSADLRANREQAEAAQLGQVKALLSSPNELNASDIQVFIGKGVINSALQSIGTIDVAVPSLGDATLRLSDASVAFTNGYPAVNLKVQVRSAQRNISAGAVVSAVLFLDTAPTALANKTLQVSLTDIAPEISLGFFDFSLKGFWKDLTAAVVQKRLAELPAFSLPLNASLPLSGGGTSTVTMPTGNGSTVTGNLIAPSISANVGLKLAHALFLEDGLHLFLQTEITP
jgi:hypothetical protein